MEHLSQQDARRIAVRAQLLTADRPSDLVDMVAHLTILQRDPIKAVAPNVDLVSWSRLGSTYSPDHLTLALRERWLVEYQDLVRPAEDIALFRAAMRSWPGRGTELRGWEARVAEWVGANDACRRDILARLEAGGPLPSRELPDTCVMPWRSTGWTNDKNVTRLLGLMQARGEVAVAGRSGRDRLWDLAERVYPDDAAVPFEEAAHTLDVRRLRALGLARATGPEQPVEPYTVGEAGVSAIVEGVPGEWRVDPEQLGRLGEPFEGRAALLSPFDRLVHDRKRSLELFGFEYLLEMYKPAAARRWGYFALPILHGDRLVGKLDATADRRTGVLRVDAVHEDVVLTADETHDLRAEVADLAGWLDLDLDVERWA